jgi:7,8-dihydroneopterin aldolase/epimerase/oxygenase
VKVELRGLHVFGYHGVEEEEQRLGQPFLYDVELEVGDRGASDRLEEAVDYTQVAQSIRELSSARRFNLLEALATAVADMLMERFEPESLRLRIRKPQVKPAGLSVEFSAVTVERP